MKRNKKAFLAKIGIIASAVSPLALVAASSDSEASVQASTLESVIQSLNAEPFESLISRELDQKPANKPSTIAKAAVVTQLKATAAYTSLSNEEKAKFSESNVKISAKDNLGVLEITISNYGAKKTIVVHGFKNDVDPRIKQFIKNLRPEHSYYSAGIKLAAISASDFVKLSFADQKWRDLFD